MIEVPNSAITAGTLLLSAINQIGGEKLIDDEDHLDDIFE